MRKAKVILLISIFFLFLISCTIGPDNSVNYESHLSETQKEQLNDERFRPPLRETGKGILGTSTRG